MKGVIYAGDKPEFVTDLEVRDVGPDEVRVAIQAAGLCHSDASVVEGVIPFPTPLVMGHEGAGIVEAVGDAVDTVKVGDHVVLSTLGNCGRCGGCEHRGPTFCERGFRFDKPFSRGGEKIFQFAGTSVFSEATVVKHTQAITIPKEVPFDVASLVGCGVITGVGAVFNRAKVRPGDSVAVIGVGGIGLNVIQAAAISGANPIIAIDALPKEELAKSFGATHFIQAGEGVDTVEAVKEIVKGGVAHGFECVGHPALIRQTIDLIELGGQAVIIGVPKMGTEASFVVSSIYNDKSIMGCRYGSARPNYDFPMIIELYLAGKLKLDELVTKHYDLSEINEALADLHDGKLARGVLNVAG